MIMATFGSCFSITLHPKHWFSLLFIWYQTCHYPAHISISDISLSRCRCDNNNRFKQIDLTTLFLSSLGCTLGALLFIYSLARRLNWKLKQQSVRNSILRLGVGFWIFQYKYERERDQWDRKSGFQMQKIAIHSVSSSAGLWIIEGIFVGPFQEETLCWICVIQ